MNQGAEEGFKMMFSKGNTPRKGSGAESEEEAAWTLGLRGGSGLPVGSLESFKLGGCSPLHSL